MSERCDHKFVDSKHCLKCGWTPPADVVEKTPVHWIIRQSEQSVWMIRHRTVSGSESPLWDYEKVINFLCERLLEESAAFKEFKEQVERDQQEGWVRD